VALSNKNILPSTCNFAEGVVVPRPNLLLLSSQKKLALFSARVVPFENITEPFVNDGNVNLLLKVVQSAELKAPLFVAEAVGTFKVITGVVVE